MSTFRLTSCLLLFTVFGCQTEPETLLPQGTSPSNAQRIAATIPATNLRLKQMVASGNNGGLGPLFTTTYFTYGQGRNLQKAVVPEPSPGVSGLTYEYTYDPQGRLSAYRMLSAKPNDAGIIGKQSTFSFGNRTVEETFAQVRVDGQLLPPYLEPNLLTIYRFNEQGQITEQIQEGILRFGSETRQRFVYTYENGNVVKQTMLNAADQVEFTISYEYDDKVNPYYQWTYLPDPVLYSSRNNIVSTRVNNNQPQRRAYTYNEQGLPLTQTYVSSGAVLNYEYETY
ncbi:hypothetical protein GCM10027347_55610 [Larkinella harenae]